MKMTNTPINKRLKEARLAAGLSQKKLGIDAGIDEFSASARMNQYETGKHTPDYLTLKNIAKILKVPVAFFYAESDELARWILIFFKISKAERLKYLRKYSRLEDE